MSSIQHNGLVVLHIQDQNNNLKIQAQDICTKVQLFFENIYFG